MDIDDVQQAERLIRAVSGVAKRLVAITAKIDTHNELLALHIGVVATTVNPVDVDLKIGNIFEREELLLQASK